jgi:hypothetical protein
MPLPQDLGIGETPFQGQVGIFGEFGQFVDEFVHATFAQLIKFRLCTQPRGLRKTTNNQALDFYQKPEAQVRIGFSLTYRHA